MPTLATSRFTKYNLTQQEELSGSILTPEQLCMIQTECAQVAEQILNLEYSPDNPLKSVQNDAFLKGQLSVYQLLIDRSSEAYKELMRLAQESSNQ
jgi:hypothetical protein